MIDFIPIIDFFCHLFRGLHESYYCLYCLLLYLCCLRYAAVSQGAFRPQEPLYRVVDWVFIVPMRRLFFVALTSAATRFAALCCPCRPPSYSSPRSPRPSLREDPACRYNYLNEEKNCHYSATRSNPQPTTLSAEFMPLRLELSSLAGSRSRACSYAHDALVGW